MYNQDIKKVRIPNAMSEQEKIQLFEDQKIRTAWDENKKEWYFSVVDVIRVLTGSENLRRYWSGLKRKLKAEGTVELYEKNRTVQNDGSRWENETD